jgi:hypothetical protein
MKTLINLIAIACAINTVVLAYLTYRYFTTKDNNLEDDGTTDTEQKD